MQFRLTNTESGDWSILDETEQPLFTGPLHACEDWLDRQESCTQQTFASRLAGFFRRSASSPARVHDAPLSKSGVGLDLSPLQDPQRVTH